MPPPDLVGWWPMDGNSEDIWDGNTGVLEGTGGQFGPAKVGRGFKSGGQRSLVTVPDVSNLDVTTFTIDAWVKIDALNFKNMPIVWKGDHAGADLSTPYSLLVGGTSLSEPDATPFVILSDGVSSQIVVASTPIPLNTFVHLAVTNDGSKIRLYIDGVLDLEVPKTVGTLFDSAHPLQIGSLSGTSANSFFNGTIDEVALFKRALSPAEILDIFNAGSAGRCKANAFMDLNVTYFNPISLSGPISNGLTSLPAEVHARFQLLKNTLPPPSVEGQPTITSTELVFGDARWTELNPAVPFKIIFEGIGTSPSVRSITYEFNPILSQAVLHSITLNSSPQLTITGTDIATGLAFHHRFQESLLTLSLAILGPDPGTLTLLADFRAELEILFGLAGLPDKFEVKSTFFLPQNSEINTATEDIRVSLKGADPIHFTLPAGVFEGDDKGRFKAEGIFDGIEVDLKIKPIDDEGTFEFKAQGFVDNLAGIGDPVTVEVLIGNDIGSATVHPDLE